jgi:soluble lytic murein transglycosylase-like protein
LTLKNIFVIAVLALCVVGASRPAQAQIYSHKDANGILVLSNDPLEGPRRMAILAPLSSMTSRTPSPLLQSLKSSFDPLIWQHSNQRGVRPELVRAVIQVESAFNPFAISPKGAMGLMQLMPATAARFGVVNAFNPAENIRAGVQYLKQLLTRYENNEQLALAAYNAGPLAVDRHGSQVPPYKETQDYVRRISTLVGTATRIPGTKLYKWTELVDGKEVPHISDKPPAGLTYQTLAR